MTTRYRIRWTKLGRTRFISARDLTSVWERAIRRADLPIAYSEGFTPHAKVSFPDALPVGAESTGDYAELTFAAPITPERDLARLSVQLPDGMDITTYMEVPSGAPKLARMLQATLWELTWPPVDAAELVPLLQRRSRELFNRERIEVVRRRHDGDRTLDIRPALLAIATSARRTENGVCTVLRAVLRNDGTTVRPTDLHAALSHGDVAEPERHCRVAQGEPTPDGLREALTATLEPMVVDVDAEAA